MKKIVSLVIAVMVFLPCVTCSFANEGWFYDFSYYEEPIDSFDEIVFYAPEMGEKTHIKLPQDKILNSIVYPTEQVYEHPESIVDKNHKSLRKKVEQSESAITSGIFDEKGNLIYLTDEDHSDWSGDYYNEYEIEYSYIDNRIVSKYDNANSEEYEYYYDDQGRLYKTKGHADQCDYYIDEMRFDKDGKEIEYTIQFHTMKEGSEGAVEDIISDKKTQKYEYYDSGLLKFVTTDRGASYSVETDIYEYNDDEQLTSRTIRLDGKINREFAYFYDNNKKMVKRYEISYYNGEVRNEYITDYQYDNQGKLVYRKYCEKSKCDDKDYIVQNTYIYNENGLVVTILTTWNNRFTETQYTKTQYFEYNDDFLIVSIKEVSEDFEHESVYEYDDNGRLISIVLLQNGVDEYITRYEYDTPSITFRDPGNSVVGKNTLADANNELSKRFSFEVNNPNACVAAIVREDGSYEVLKAKDTNDPDVHSFSIDEVTDNMNVLVVQRGDLNLDGKIAVNDVTMAKAASLSKLDLTPEAKLAADMNGDGVIRANEVAMLRAAALKKAVLSW